MGNYYGGFDNSLYGVDTSTNSESTPKSGYQYFAKAFDSDGSADNGLLFDWSNTQWRDKGYVNDLVNRARIYGLKTLNANTILDYAKAYNNMAKYFTLDNSTKLWVFNGKDARKALLILQDYNRKFNAFKNAFSGLRQSLNYIDAAGNIVNAKEGDDNYDWDLKNSQDHFGGFKTLQEMEKDIVRANRWASKDYADTMYNNSLNTQGSLSTIANFNAFNDSNKTALATLWGNNDNNVTSGNVTNWYGTNAKAAEKAWYDKQSDLTKYNYLRWKLSGAAKSMGVSDTSNLIGSATINDIANALFNNYMNTEEALKDFLGNYKDDFYKRYRQSQSNLNNSVLTQGNLRYTSLFFKHGGIMNKFQEGGKASSAADLVIQAIQAAQQGDQSGLQKLFGDKETAQAVIALLQKEAQEGSEKAVQALRALKLIMGNLSESAQMARKGAKIAYIHRLSTGCPADSELVYFKKGGRLCKACVKKAQRRVAEVSDKVQEATSKAKFRNGGYISYFSGGGKSSSNSNNTVRRVRTDYTDDGYEMHFSDGTYSSYGKNPMNGKSVAIGRDGKTYTGEKADSVYSTDIQKTVPAIKNASKKPMKKRQLACGGKTLKKKKQ